MKIDDIAINTFIQWAIQQHEKTNHLYADYIPYRFHLDMVAQVASQFKEVWQANFEDDLKFHIVALSAAYGHDLIEDARVTPNDILKMTSKEVVDIIYACTNNKGWTRSERADDAYYAGIRNTPGAVFIKLCDRIANVKFGLMTGKGRMYRVYKEEQNDFLIKLGVWDSESKYAPMVKYLDFLLSNPL